VNVLDLFSGLGGFSLGLERAGMRTVAFCEIDPYCRRVLAKHWPDVPIWPDIRTLRPVDIPAVDLVCGGFPCQPFSSAARGRNRSDGNLWPEMRRIISECRPAWIICENVVGLDRLAIRQVVADLEGLGYEIAPPFEIPACAVGHDHKRSRLWIVGHADRNGQPSRTVNGQAPGMFGYRPIAGNDRATDGIPCRMDRLRALGNAVVPQIPEIIGRAIMKQGSFANA
jgi:DNA (cytosine-5)-methyltransferase 1